MRPAAHARGRFAAAIDFWYRAPMPAVPQASARPVTWHVALIVAAVAVVYVNSFQNSFLWDDRYLVVENPRIKAWNRLPELFTSDLFPQGVLSRYYRPLQAATYAVDYHVWGLDPLGFHLTNTALHASVAVALYWLGCLLLASAPAALMGALLFAVHPIHTEAVTYIAGRSDPLAALFVLLSLIAFLHQRGRRFGSWGVASLVAFALALFAREAAMGMVLLVVLVDLTARVHDDGAATRRSWVRVVARSMPYLAVLVGYLMVRARVVGVGGLPTAVGQIPLPLRALTMASVVIEYLALMVVPVGQHMERLVMPARSLLEPATVGALALVAALVAAAVWCRPRAWPITFGLAWFFVALIPVSNVVPLTTFMAEHWLYVPSMGLFLALGWALQQLAERGWEQAVVAGLLVAMGIYGSLTVRRNLDWKDGVTFYRATLELAPYSARAWANLGTTYQELGRLAEAQDAYQQALKRAPNAADVVQNLGVVDATRGNADDAVAAYERAIHMDSDFAGPHNNLGNIYRAQKRFEDAEQEFTRALAIDPNYVAAYNNLGLALEAMGRGDEARAAYESALRLDPDFAAAHSNLGNFYFRRDDLQRALPEYLAAVRLNPDYAEAYNNLGSVYFRLGQPERAEEAYRKALQINPTLEEVRRNLVVVQQSRQQGATPAGR